VGSLWSKRVRAEFPRLRRRARHSGHCRGSHPPGGTMTGRPRAPVVMPARQAGKNGVLLMSDLPAAADRPNGHTPAPDRVAEMAQLLEAHRGERHIIVLQNYPDPDAISSAFAHQ